MKKMGKLLSRVKTKSDAKMGQRRAHIVDEHKLL